MQTTSNVNRPPIDGQSDAEYKTRIEAQRCTLEFSQKMHRPLFGGEAQDWLFGEVIK